MKRREAFTLVEMMVALAVTSVLTVMMLKMFSDSSTIWKTEDDRLDTFREARAALQLMSREFSTALPLPNATQTGITDQYPVIATVDRQTRATPGLSTEFFTSAYLLAAVPNAGHGDLCAVGYSLVWEPDVQSGTPSNSSTASLATPRSAYVLRRQAAQSDTTFVRVRDTLNATSPLFGLAAFNLLYSTKAPTSTGSIYPTPAPTTETIASYIWDLEFAVAPPLPTETAPVSTGKNSYYGTKLPEWVEIRFKAMGSTAARKLAGNPLVTQEVWAKPADPVYTRLILPVEQQFVSRVKLAR